MLILCFGLPENRRTDFNLRASEIGPRTKRRSYADFATYRRVLLFEDSFHLADFLLNLARDLFVLTVRFFSRIICRAANLLFDFTFHFMELSLRFVLRALCHCQSTYRVKHVLNEAWASISGRCLDGEVEYKPDT
jgi:hypothetical protein